MTKNEVIEVVTELLWNEAVEEKVCDILYSVMDPYLQNKEDPQTWRDPKTGEVVEYCRYVSATEYLQSIESLLERIADALGA